MNKLIILFIMLIVNTNCQGQQPVDQKIFITEATEDCKPEHDRLGSVTIGDAHAVFSMPEGSELYLSNIILDNFNTIYTLESDSASLEITFCTTIPYYNVDQWRDDVILTRKSCITAESEFKLSSWVTQSECKDENTAILDVIHIGDNRNYHFCLTYHNNLKNVDLQKQFRSVLEQLMYQL